MTRVLLPVLLVLVVACGSENNPPVSDEAENVQWMRIGFSDSVARIEVDGIDCVVYDGYRAGGISCDWHQG